LQDVAHRLVADVVAQIVDRTGNSVVTSRRIVSGQTDDEFFDFRFGRQSPVPFKNCLGFDDGDRVRHEFAEGGGLLGEGAAFVVGQEIRLSIWLRRTRFSSRRHSILRNRSSLTLPVM
jgi:hypothetical protein